MGRLLTLVGIGMGRYTLNYITPFCLHQRIALLFLLSDCHETQLLLDQLAHCSVYEK
jgi:hypothetical protein